MKRRTRNFSLEDTERTTAGPSEVMANLLDPSTWPAWQPEIITSEGPSPLRKGDVVTGSADMLGFAGVQGRSSAVDVGESHFEEDVVVGIGMRIRYEVDSDGNGALVTHRLESDLPTGFSGRLLSFLLRKRLRRLQRTALERLAAQSEMNSPGARRSSA
jgi:hypothetical protein